MHSNNMHLKVQDMTNRTNKKALNSIQNELNYRSVNRGMSSGNLEILQVSEGVT